MTNNTTEQTNCPRWSTTDERRWTWQTVTSNYAEETTSTNGEFTLRGVCSEAVEIWAKLDRELYGAAETRYGRRDLTLVVHAIR